MLDQVHKQDVTNIFIIEKDVMYEFTEDGLVINQNCDNVSVLFASCSYLKRMWTSGLAFVLH